MSQEFKKGDRVAWRSHRGKAEGEVLRKITEDTELVGRKVRASKDDPQYPYAATRAVAKQCTNHRR
jgi:Hypervirulence associated proteins TUDOR domain